MSETDQGTDQADTVVQGGDQESDRKDPEVTAGILNIIEAKMASVKLEPPSFVSDRKSYESYKRELTIWSIATCIEKSKQALVIVLSLPENHDSNIREKVFAEMKVEDLNKENGLEALIEFFDKRFAKDTFVVAYEKYQKWNGLLRKADEKVENFISNYESVCNEAENHGIQEFEIIKGFKLLDACCLEPFERQLVFTGIDFDSAKTNKNLFEQMKNAIKKFKGEQSKIIQGSAERIDAVFLSENEEVLAAHGYKKVKSRLSYVQNKKMNPKDCDGERYTCFNCGSVYHYIANCPNVKREKKKWQRPVDEVSLVSIDADNETLCLLVGETEDKAVLDCACTATVAGTKWIERYIADLTGGEQKRIEEYQGEKTFKFGGGVKKKSLKRLVLPVHIAGLELKITTDVVDAEIPMLLSLQAMKRGKMVVNFEKDEAEIMGRKVKLNKTSTGHYSVSLKDKSSSHVSDKHVAKDKDVIDINENLVWLNMLEECFISIDSVDKNERYKALKKLHEQMGHLPIDKLIKSSGKWKEDMGELIEHIESNCRTCKLYAKTPPKPVVALSRANKFNEVLSMDLKTWKGKLILYLIDQWSRMTVGVFVKSKKPKEVVEAIWMKWIAVGYGRPEYLHSDLGGEFSNEELIEVADQLGCKVSCTAGYSPHQNGLNERNHAVNDKCMDKIKEDHPEMKDEMVLAHALFAKNCLQMTYGYSAIQLVLGQNPNLPNNNDATPPMLEDSIEGNVLRNHLNVLHSARIAFMKCEADTKIKRALRHNVRNFSQNVVIGDMVYYKRNDKKWKGPGKIIGKDGAKIFLVAQGGLTYRVEGNAIVKVGEEFSPDIHEVKEKEQLVPKVMDNGVSEANKNAAVSEEIQSVVENNEETIVNTEDEQSITGATNNNNSLTKQRVVLKKNEKIRFKETEDEGWKEGTVLQRAGKATGKYDGYYNIQLNNHSKDIIVIDMHNVPEWDKIDSFSTLSDEETAWVVFVPKEKLKDKEVVEARMKQLNDWKLFDVYEEVDDCGQEKIRGGWIDVYKKVDGEVVVKSRFVARGYMEDVHIRSDSPTVRKDNIRLICMIAAVNGWRLETKDYRSAFLQGTEIDRQLFMEPPEEEKKPGVI